MLNITVLQRIDPFIEEILITAAHVTFYEFNVDLNQWVRSQSLSLHLYLSFPVLLLCSFFLNELNYACVSIPAKPVVGAADELTLSSSIII